MADTNSNGRVARVLCIVLISLVLTLMAAIGYNAVALADTNERVAKLEAQTDYIIKSLERIERAVGTAGGERSRP